MATAAKESTKSHDKAIAEMKRRAEAVGAELRKSSGKAEELRRVPMEHLERIIDQGLLGVIQSRRTG